MFHIQPNFLHAYFVESYSTNIYRSRSDPLIRTCFLHTQKASTQTLALLYNVLAIHIFELNFIPSLTLSIPLFGCLSSVRLISLYIPLPLSGRSLLNVPNLKSLILC